MNDVEKNIEVERGKVDELRAICEEKKLILQDKNKKNLELASQITKLKAMLSGDSTIRRLEDIS